MQTMNAPALVVASLMSSCKHVPPTSTGAGIPSCPSHALEVSESCTPSVGSPEQPLEWGEAAAGDSPLWLGRLACQDGAVPQTQRLRSLAYPALESASPRSALPLPADGAERLDVWSVQCPGEDIDHLWVANTYRCGELCPPEGFRLLPADASLALDAARDAMAQGDPTAAAHLTAIAVQTAPDFEVTHFTHGATRMALDDPAGALQAFNDAAAINPDNISGLYARVVLLRATGQQETAHALATRLLEITPPQHPQRPHALCMAALTQQEQGQTDEASQLAAQACAMGFTPCCDFSH